MNEGLFGALAGQPGMFGDPPAKKPGGITNALSYLFTGPSDPRLSPEQNAQAQKLALLRGGLATILSASQNPDAMAALATGALAGQETRMQYGQQQVEQTQMQELAKLAQSGQLTPEVLKKLFQHAVATGNANLANAVVGMLNNISPEAGIMFGGPQNRYVFDKAGNKLHELPTEPEYVSTDLGDKVIWTVKGQPNRVVHVEYKGRSPNSNAARGQPRPYIDPVTGEQKFGTFNPDTNTMEPVEGALPVVGASEDERKAQSFLMMVPRHIEFADSIEKAPGRIAQALTDKGLREFTSDEMQRLKLAAIVIGEAWLRMTTGAGYNQTEMENAGYAFLPMPGDTASTLEEKRHMRRTLMEMLRVRAGRARPRQEGGAPKGAPQGAPQNSGDPFAGLPVRKK